MKYFSDSERGVLPRINNEIPYNVWCGLTAHIQTLIDTGYFGEKFPELCPDGQGCCGTNKRGFSQSLKAEILTIDYPFVTEKEENTDGWISKDVPFTPSYLDVLDLVQFCYMNISEPTIGEYHSYYGHHHLVSFDSSLAGKVDFIEKVNLMFSRNGVAYQLHTDGKITRVLNASLESVVGKVNQTADQELNDLIARANAKICNADVQIRYDALKELWDGFERIKTVFDTTKNKKQSMTQLLEACSSDQDFRTQLDLEARALTTIGNAFFIRHSEVTQVKLNDSDHIEYLFHRLASLMCLLAKKL